MGEVSARDLHNEGERLLDRVIAGERITITRNGEPVAQLVPVGRARLSADELVERFRRLPPMDPVEFRRDVDSIVDQSL